MDIWELRFADGRGASLFTNVDVSGDVGREGVVRTIRVAAHVTQERAVADARRCFERGAANHATAHMGAVVFAIRHVV